MYGVPTLCQACAGAIGVSKTKSPVITSTPSTAQSQTVNMYQFSLQVLAKRI